MKKLFISTILVIITISILAISIMSIDYHKAYQDLVEDIKIDSTVMNEANFKINKFPIPHFVIDQITLNNKITLKNVEAKFSIASLIAMDPKLSSLKIGEAFIHLNHDNIDFINHDQLISELISKNALSVKAEIQKLTFVESDFDIPLVIENFIFRGNEQKTTFAGIVNDVGNIQGSFINSNDNILFQLYLNSKDYALDIEETYVESQLTKGKATIESSNLPNRLLEFIPHFYEHYNQTSSNEKIEITLDIVPSKTHLDLQNIIISSESIYGTGNASLGKDNSNISNINLKFMKLDIDSLFNSNLDSSQFTYGNYSKHLDLSKYPMNAHIYIKNSKLDKYQSLNNVNIKVNTENDNLHLKEFSGKIDKSGDFNVSGILTQNSFRNLFNGKITLTHSDLNSIIRCLGFSETMNDVKIPFSLSSDIKMSSVDFSLQNLLIKTKETDITGHISTKFIGDLARTNTIIRVSLLDLDKGEFPILSETFNYISNLFDDMQKEDYLSKFIPIRKIKSVASHDITFDRIIVKEKLYDNINFNLETSPGKISVNQLFIENGDNWIDSSISLDAKNLKPLISLTIHGGSAKVDFLSAAKILELRNKIADNFDLNKIDIAIDCSIKKLYDNNFAIERVLFKAQNKKNLLDVTKLNADILGGRLYSSGNILLEPCGFDFSYSLNSAHIEKIAGLLPENLLRSGGILNAEGVWSTHGDTLKEQLYNLYIKSTIMAKNSTFHDFSLDDFIQNIRNIDYNVANLDEDTKKAMLTGKTSVSELKTDIELIKGVFTLSSLNLKTQHSAASGAALFSLYDFDLNGSGTFAFYHTHSKYAKTPEDYAPANVSIVVQGSPFAPKKVADINHLKQILNKRPTPQKQLSN